jgi:hypothetical protein
MMTLLSRWCDPRNNDKHFNVSYMTWDTFFEALMDPERHKNVTAMLAASDCVIGGVDVSTPYM